jgi:hypothetical protein
MDDITEARLLSTPLRRIGLKLLSEYSWSATGTNSEKFDAYELRYFLPRYFHFIAYELFPSFAGEWQPTLSQLGALRYRDKWPEHEVAVADDFFAAFIDHQLRRPLDETTRQDGSKFSFTEINDALGMIARGGGSMAQSMREWELHDHINATHHLACFIVDCRWSAESGSARHGLPGSYWDNFEDQAKQVRQWLFRVENAERCANAIPRTPNDGVKKLLANARDFVLTDRG